MPVRRVLRAGFGPSGDISPHQYDNYLIYSHFVHTNNKNSKQPKNQAITEYFIDKKR